MILHISVVNFDRKNFWRIIANCIEASHSKITNFPFWTRFLCVLEMDVSDSFLVNSSRSSSILDPFNFISKEFGCTIDRLGSTLGNPGRSRGVRVFCLFGFIPSIDLDRVVKTLLE